MNSRGNLVVLAGHKGSGKDTAASVLINRGWVDLKMADTLKDMLRTLYTHAGFPPEEIERRIEGDLKEVPCPVLGGKTPRFAMQKLGHEWRDMIFVNLWTMIWKRRVMNLRAQGFNVVCTDLRYHHELEAAHDLGALSIRINRPDLEVDMSHPSEQEIPHLAVHTNLLNDKTPLVAQERLLNITEHLYYA